MSNSNLDIQPIRNFPKTPTFKSQLYDSTFTIPNSILFIKHSSKSTLLTSPKFRTQF